MPEDRPACIPVHNKILRYWIILYIYIDPFNKYRVRNFHPMTSTSFEFAFWILFNYIYSLNKPETINEIENNSKVKLKRIWRHWVKITYSLLIKRVYILIRYGSWIASHQYLTRFNKRQLTGEFTECPFRISPVSVEVRCGSAPKTARSPLCNTGVMPFSLIFKREYTTFAKAYSWVIASYVEKRRFWLIYIYTQRRKIDCN